MFEKLLTTSDDDDRHQVKAIAHMAYIPKTNLFGRSITKKKDQKTLTDGQTAFPCPLTT